MLEMNRMTFLPASIKPKIDAAKDMGSTTESCECCSIEVEVESERTSPLSLGEASFSR